MLAFVSCLSATPYSGSVAQDTTREQQPASQTAQPASFQGQAVWRIASLEGEVQVRAIGDDETPGAWRMPVVGERLEGRVEVETGANGRVWLVRDGDIVTLHGATAVRLPDAAEEDAPIEQMRGFGNYQVEKRPEWSFKVKTPFLLALVKGTTFDVDIAEDYASLAVTEGVVNVSADENENGQDVIHGQTAQVSALSPSKVFLFQSSSRPRQGAGGMRMPAGPSRPASPSREKAAQRSSSEDGAEDADEDEIVVASNMSGPNSPAGGDFGSGENNSGADRGAGGGDESGTLFGTPISVILVGLFAFIVLFGSAVLAFIKAIGNVLLRGLSFSRGGEASKGNARPGLYGKS